MGVLSTARPAGPIRFPPSSWSACPHFHCLGLELQHPWKMQGPRPHPSFEVNFYSSLRLMEYVSKTFERGF